LSKLQVKMMDTIIEIVSDDDTLRQIRRIYCPYVLEFITLPDYIFEVDRVQDDKVLATWENPQVDEHSGTVSLRHSSFNANIDMSTHKSTGYFYSSQIARNISYCIIQLLSMDALGKGGLLLHSACIERNDRAYFFMGHSGSGKSTVAQLSLPARVLNDDLVGILPTKTGWMAFPLPFWHNKQTRPSAETNPVLAAGFYKLIQSSEISITRLSTATSTARLVSSTAILSSIPQLAERVIQISLSIANVLPVYDLCFQKNNLFWDTILNVYP